MRSITASCRKGRLASRRPTRRRLSAAGASGPRSPSSRRRTASRVLRSPGRADRRTQRSEETLSKCRRAHPVSSAGWALLAFLGLSLGVQHPTGHPPGDAAGHYGNEQREQARHELGADVPDAGAEGDQNTGIVGDGLGHDRRVTGRRPPWRRIRLLRLDAGRRTITRTVSREHFERASSPTRTPSCRSGSLTASRSATAQPGLVGQGLVLHPAGMDDVAEPGVRLPVILSPPRAHDAAQHGVTRHQGWPTSSVYRD